jgi:hypothetical protein
MKATNLLPMNLLEILVRYEGALSEVEREGNDSEEALRELEEARTNLLDLLRVAKGWEADREKSLH